MHAVHDTWPQDGHCRGAPILEVAHPSKLVNLRQILPESPASKGIRGSCRSASSGRARIQDPGRVLRRRQLARPWLTPNMTECGSFAADSRGRPYQGHPIPPNSHAGSKFSQSPLPAKAVWVRAGQPGPGRPDPRIRGGLRLPHLTAQACHW